MKQNYLLASAAACILSLASQAQAPQTMSKSADTAKSSATKKPIVADKVKGNKKMEGLFTIYQDTATGSTQLYIKKAQLGKNFVYQSFSENGPNSVGLGRGTFRDNAVICFKKYYDRIEAQRMNTHYYYDKKNPVSKAEDVNKPEAIFLAEKIVAEDSLGYLIAADGLFIGEKLDQVRPTLPPGIPPGLIFNLGLLNTAKSQYYKIRSYSNNTDVIVDLAYDNPSPFNGGGNDIADARFNRVRIQHTFIEIPEHSNFKPRMDDPRVGYFTEEVTDLTSITPTPFHDFIHRWNLQKKDPNATLSEPVEPIVWWIENTTPYEYRETIKEAGEKWNEAFEKAGFKNAIVMKVQPDDATWDAGDVRYNVIRWVSSPYPSYGAYGPSFVNPLTGEILGADIMVEWFSGSATPIYDEIFNNPGGQIPEMNNPNACTMAKELKMQFMTGLTALEATGAPESEIKEMHKQFLYYLVLHEMGHTMGLNHNMKASQMLSPAQLNDKSITRTKGLQGSVMDYPAINVSLDRSKQGDYYTTKPGPYDLWAIEFGYTPTSNDAEEASFRKKVLSRSTDPDLAFGNDADDMRSPGKAIDPRVNVNDMSNDAVAYAEDRFKLVNTLMPKLKDKYSKANASYAELRARYGLLNNQRASMIAAVSRYIGGVYVDRSFVGQGNSKPFTPVPLSYQKKAMDVLTKYVFAPNAFDADKQVFPYLQSQRRGFDFFATTEDYKLTAVMNGLGTSPLAHILHPVTLQRITNSRLYGNEYSVADVMNDLTKGIFDADLSGNVNVYRQYLQTSYVKSLVDIVNEKSPYDDVSKADARYTLKKIKTKLAAATAGNEETKAHRGNLIFLIDNALTVK
jgi:hypothetical protein